ncbi:uncharacterized protein KY384_005797 [Bacidia gigantensis]|uniref:uncharacterized protein n=1 Tax=Bacidia gigantensis TaxID=2732470 RepID=UPI001D03E9FA|nr:uncharacterized protein KY384_005797 [Bacidia gigantensis]KAG8529162.1 hypothetical protein KY384_005797 [Bacidia gigantensis]
MSPQHYERVSTNDQDETPMTPISPQDQRNDRPSPPPSFRSRTSSPSSRHLLSSEDPIITDAERTLNDTFDDGSDSDDEGDNGGDDRQRLMRSATSQSRTDSRLAQDGGRPDLLRSFTRFPGHEPSVPVQATTTQAIRSAPQNPYARLNDGVFANLNAKPERGEKLEEQPPSYEDAAADATPPYWEPTTIFAPGNLSSSDEVYVDGLPVGSLFSFIWNGMISMSFQLVGFLLTYLLHTTHAAKNGSRAGLGITLVQYGFYMRAGAHKSSSPSDTNDSFAPPADPNNHDFDPSTQPDSAAAATAAAMSQSAADAASSGSSSSTDWIAYAVMIIGWFILIRAVSDFIKARKHEQLVLQSPDRGLNVPVVADNERPETAV